MPWNLSAAAVLEKNKLASDGAWLLLVEIGKTGMETLRAVRNTENITWCGHVWAAYPFSVDLGREDSTGEIQSVTLAASNVGLTLMPALEEYEGLRGATVVLRYVHSKHLDNATPEIEVDLSVTATEWNAETVTFTLGMDFPLRQRYPLYRLQKNSCAYKYGNIQCGVPAATVALYPTCDRTLVNCRERGNQARFGGEPAIPVGGFYA